MQNFRIPDFSKVEPRVHFLKGGYRPPKSRYSSKMESLSSEPALMFKSPADIVKEVLLNTTDGSPVSSDSFEPPASALKSTVPQEFRCRQQAATLFEQLQEDHNKLLINYAKAENTIDRLRLEAKDRSTNLHSLSFEPNLVFKCPADIVKDVLLNTTDGSPASSDSHEPPTSALNSTVPQEFRCRQQATTLVEKLQEDHNRLLIEYAEAKNTIDCLRLKDMDRPMNVYSDPPQAQRADVNSASLQPNGQSTHQGGSSAFDSTRSPEPRVLKQLAGKFLQQLQTFEHLLKSKKLKPLEQMDGLSLLAEGLNSLERGYLLAWGEHKRLQQRGADSGHFDPEQELERMIFQCGLRMDELKEQVKQMPQEQPTCEAPPSPPPHLILLSVPSEGGETLNHPQSPPVVPLLVDPGEAAAVQVSPVSEESEEEKETLISLHSPETDSEFVCLESSHLTSAAAPSPLHQKASERVSVPQERNLGKPQIGSVRAPSPASSPSHSPSSNHPRWSPTLTGGQVITYNAALQMIHAGLVQKLERNKTSSVRAAPSTQNYTHQNTSTPRGQPWERRGDVIDEVDCSTLRRTTRQRYRSTEPECRSVSDSSPFYVSPSNNTGVRGRGEVLPLGRTRFSLSATKQCSMDTSLNRGITAARHMDHSPAPELYYHEMLAKLCFKH